MNFTLTIKRPWKGIPWIGPLHIPPWAVTLPLPEYFPTKHLAIPFTGIFIVITFTRNMYAGLIDIGLWRGIYEACLESKDASRVG
jgi:hypothetical protein